VPSDVPDEYFSRLKAVRPSEKIDSKGMTTHQWIKSGDDHWRGCEKENLIVALAAGLL